MRTLSAVSIGKTLLALGIVVATLVGFAGCFRTMVYVSIEDFENTRDLRLGNDRLDEPDGVSPWNTASVWPGRTTISWNRLGKRYEYDVEVGAGEAYLFVGSKEPVLRTDGDARILKKTQE